MSGQLPTLRHRTPHHRGSSFRTAATGTVTVGLAVLGCGGASTASTSANEDRLAEPAAELLWTVGGIEGEGWQTFSDRVQVAFDAAGQVRIFDSMGGRIHLLSPDGTHLRTWGDQGEGPGELSIPMDFVVHPDGVTSVLDYGKRGFVQFDPEGEYLADLPMDFSAGVPMDGLVAHPAGGAVAAGSGMFMRMGGAAQEITIPIRHFAFDGTGTSLVHEAWNPPHPGDNPTPRFDGGDHQAAYESISLVAFQPGLHLAVLPDGRLLVADSTTWALEVLAPDGTPLGEFERPYTPRPVTPAMQQAERQRRLRALEDGGPSSTGEVVMNALHGGGPSLQPSEPSEGQIAQIETMLFAEVLPVISRVRTDWEGRIWVERTGEDPSEAGPVDLMDSEGIYLATIPPEGVGVPAAFGPDGLAAYIELDELDVPTVRVVRLRGLPG